MIWLIWLCFIVVDAFVNHCEIKGKLKIYHGVNSAYRMVIGALLVFLFQLSELETVMFVLGGFFSFWLLFNFILNAFNGWPWDFLGSTSILDRFESMAPTFILWVKLVCTAGFVYGFFHTELL